MREQAPVQNNLRKAEGSRRSGRGLRQAGRGRRDLGKQGPFHPKGAKFVKLDLGSGNHRRERDVKGVAALHHRTGHGRRALPFLVATGMSRYSRRFDPGERAVIRGDEPDQHGRRHEERGSPAGLAQSRHEFPIRRFPLFGKRWTTAAEGPVGREARVAPWPESSLKPHQRA